MFPGNTVDAIFEWTGAGLGWDAYGHSVSGSLEPNEHALDHGKPLPVVLPDETALMFGSFFGGGPFLGVQGGLPPGGMNPGYGYAFMWHSHAEREMVNFNSSPGGMMTMLVIVPHGVVIP